MKPVASSVSKATKSIHPLKLLQGEIFLNCMKHQNPTMKTKHDLSTYVGVVTSLAEDLKKSTDIEFLREQALTFFFESNDLALK